MNSRLAGWVAGVCVATAVFGATVASARDRSGQAAKRSRAAAGDPVPAIAVSDPEAYERELKAAQEQRDRELRDAERETDRRAFEKRKAAIFAQYAAILTEMNERYKASGADVPVAGKSAPAKKAKANAPLERPGRPTYPPEPRKKPAPWDAEKAPAADPADIQKQLDEETARHESAMADLNRQLRDAQDSGTKREIRKAERAIDKENSEYQSRKTRFEQQLKDLGFGGDSGPSGGRKPASGKSGKKPRK